METTHYLNEFQKTLDRLDLSEFHQHQLELKAGVWLNSVALKIQKRSWLSSSPDARPFEGSIFFSVWINEEAIREKKLFYNIHALKLRELKGYAIKSREFAAAFRTRFEVFEKRWPHVSVDFGPQTLMEGWVGIEVDDFGQPLSLLAYKFLEIQSILDELLAERKK